MTSGIGGLDPILGGGYPKGRLMLLEGAPGTGKTTIALHFLIAAAASGQRALFVSVAQSLPELQVIAASHGMSLDGVDVHTPELGMTEKERIFSVDSDEAELVALMDDVGERIEKTRPDVFVFDSLLEMRLLASRLTVYRRELLALRRRLRQHEITSILIDHLEPEGGERNAEGIVHGVLKLDTFTPAIGTIHRRLTVLKLRGSSFVEGWHDFRIDRGGITVFPRVIPEDAPLGEILAKLEPPDEPLRNLLGGGIEFGTTLLVTGQSGTGKSTIATVLARAAADRGERVAFFLFEERPEVMVERSAGVGLDLTAHRDNERIVLPHFDPAEVSPGEFSSRVIGAVEEGASVIVIDSITGYLNALTEEANALTHIHTLLQYLARRGALVIVTVSQHGLLGEDPRTELDTSFIADSVILLRQYEAGSEIRRSIAVVKKRHSDHQRNIEELVIRQGAVEVRSLSEEAEKRARQSPNLGG